MKNIKTLEYVNKNSKYVSINAENIHVFLNSINSYEYHYWLSTVDLDLTEEEIIIFAFVCESMNFCFWGNRDWTVTYKDKQYNGSEALFYTIIKIVEDDKNFLNLENLLKLKKSEFRRRLKANNKFPPLLSKRYKLLKKTAKVIKRKKGKLFSELFSLKSDEELLNYIVNNFKHFNDKSQYKKNSIFFNKRAILLVNDLFNLSSIIKQNIGNIDSMSGGADYAIPQILEEFGIFVYNDKLKKIIAASRNIRHNCHMEVEIRANTLYVLELMREILNSRGIKINSIELDNIIWKMRKQVNGNLPVHHTKTIFY